MSMRHIHKRSQDIKPVLRNTDSAPIIPSEQEKTETAEVKPVAEEPVKSEPVKTSKKNNAQSVEKAEETKKL